MAVWSRRRSSAPGQGEFTQDLGIDFIGMTVADAQAAAVKAGWQGRFKIKRDGSGSRCDVGTVCWFEPADWKFSGDPPALVFHVVATPAK